MQYIIYRPTGNKSLVNTSVKLDQIFPDDSSIDHTGWLTD